MHREIWLSEPPLPTPVLRAFGGEVPEVPFEALRRRVAANEQLRAIAEAKSRRGLLGGELFVAVTDQRLQIAEEADVRNRGELGDDDDLLTVACADLQGVAAQASAEHTLLP